MSYSLGIDVGTTFTAAAICREIAGRRPLPEVIPLGSRSVAVSSVVYLGKDGQVVVGEAAERRAVTDPYASSSGVSATRSRCPYDAERP
jgi:molecular chaperone DnaK